MKSSALRGACWCRRMSPPHPQSPRPSSHFRSAWPGGLVSEAGNRRWRWAIFETAPSLPALGNGLRWSGPSTKNGVSAPRRCAPNRHLARRPLSGNGQEIGPLLDCSRWQLRQFRRHRQGERRRARGHPAAFSTRSTTQEPGILQLNVHQRRCILGVLRQAAPSHAPAGGAPLAAKGPSEVGVRVPVAGRRRDHPSGPPAAAKLIKSTWRRPQGEHQNPSLPRPQNAPSSQPPALSSTQALNALVFVRATPP